MFTSNYLGLHTGVTLPVTRQSLLLLPGKEYSNTVGLLLVLDMIARRTQTGTLTQTDLPAIVSDPKAITVSPPGPEIPGSRLATFGTKISLTWGIRVFP
ncbi:Uncharacterized protein HZ326_2753 [Fusarium oxysporum f. sp. albedinis]|nr:Uncharacterized protein HZ326_2753 [Fusarium oxysporum f. sp. albedinis]